MFEHFTATARTTVAAAQEEARSLGHDWIGTEHLLLALCADPGAAGQTLRASGADADRVREALQVKASREADVDSDALGSLGIDLEDVRRRVEETFGAGALDEPVPGRRGRLGRRRGFGATPFTHGAKASLERAVREARQHGQTSIGGEVILLGILDADDTGTNLLRGLGVEPTVLRTSMVESLRHSA